MLLQRKEALVLYVKKYVEATDHSDQPRGQRYLTLFFHSWENGTFRFIHEYNNQRYAGGGPFNPVLYDGHKIVSKGDFVIKKNHIFFISTVTVRKDWHEYVFLALIFDH